MEGKAAKDAFLKVNTDGYGWPFLFFNDGEPVIMNYADSTVNGSALNIKLTECVKADKAAYAEYLALIDSIDEAFDALPEEEQDKDWKPMVCMLRLIKKFDGLRIYRLDWEEED